MACTTDMPHLSRSAEGLPCLCESCLHPGPGLQPQQQLPWPAACAWPGRGSGRTAHPTAAPAHALSSHSNICVNLDVVCCPLSLVPGTGHSASWTSCTASVSWLPNRLCRRWISHLLEHGDECTVAVQLQRVQVVPHGRLRTYMPLSCQTCCLQPKCGRACNAKNTQASRRAHARCFWGCRQA